MASIIIVSVFCIGIVIVIMSEYIIHEAMNIYIDGQSKKEWVTKDIPGGKGTITYDKNATGIAITKDDDQWQD